MKKQAEGEKIICPPSRVVLGLCSVTIKTNTMPESSSFRNLPNVHTWFELSLFSAQNLSAIKLQRSCQVSTQWCSSLQLYGTGNHLKDLICTISLEWFKKKTWHFVLVRKPLAIGYWPKYSSKFVLVRKPLAIGYWPKYSSKFNWRCQTFSHMFLSSMTADLLSVTPTTMLLSCQRHNNPLVIPSQRSSTSPFPWSFAILSHTSANYKHVDVHISPIKTFDTKEHTIHIE
jgi:hypothetical protein